MPTIADEPLPQIDARPWDDLLQPSAVADPYPFFARLRERAPVHFSEPLGAWLISRYDDVNAALRSSQLSSDRIGPWYHGKLSHEERQELEPTYRMLSSWMVFNDPPEHTRLRKLVQKAFTPRMIESLRPRIEQVVGELLAELHGAGRVDILHRFAYPLPAIVIAEMLGVPPEDRDTFKRWSDEITALVFGALGDDDRHRRAQLALTQLTDYFRDMLVHHKEHPRDDLMTALLQAEEAGDALGRDEIITTCVLLLFAGHETTTNLIANGLKALLEHPDQLRALRAAPERISLATEELIRFEGPLKSQMRSVTKDTAFGGQQLRAGQRVYVLQAAANRDPDRFAGPDVLDLTRRDANAHVGFGFGIHYCLGAPLARLETALALNGLLKRFPDIELPDQQVSWHPVLITRSMRSLDVVL